MVLANGTNPDTPLRLVPFLAQWDYMSAQLLARLEGIDDAEYLWEPAPEVWTVRRTEDGRTVPEQRGWAPTPESAKPRTIAWSVGHLGWTCFMRADWLVGSHSMGKDALDWPMGLL